MARRKSYPTKVGRRLKAARLKTGMSQDDAAVALRGILPPSRRPSGSQISRMETGQIRDPQVYVVAALARVFGQPLEKIAPELVDEAIAVRSLLKDVIDLRDLPMDPLTWEALTGYQDPLPFDDFDLPVVIDLRDHVVAQLAQNESLPLLRNAS